MGRACWRRRQTGCPQTPTCWLASLCCLHACLRPGFTGLHATLSKPRSPTPERESEGGRESLAVAVAAAAVPALVLPPCLPVLLTPALLRASFAQARSQAGGRSGASFARWRRLGLAQAAAGSGRSASPSACTSRRSQAQQRALRRSQAQQRARPVRMSESVLQPARQSRAVRAPSCGPHSRSAGAARAETACLRRAATRWLSCPGLPSGRCRRRVAGLSRQTAPERQSTQR